MKKGVVVWYLRIDCGHTSIRAVGTRGGFELRPLHPAQGRRAVMSDRAAFFLARALSHHRTQSGIAGQCALGLEPRPIADLGQDHHRRIVRDAWNRLELLRESRSSRRTFLWIEYLGFEHVPGRYSTLHPIWRSQNLTRKHPLKSFVSLIRVERFRGQPP